MAKRTRSPDLSAAERSVAALLEALGFDPAGDPELAETPSRAARALATELLVGYDTDADELVAQGVCPGSAGLVAVRDVPVHTMCPHHLLPASGRATVAFQPRAHILGVGTVGELIDAYARRLCLQEELGENVADTLFRHLAPEWVAVGLRLAHACCLSRGTRPHGSTLETFSFRGPDGSRAQAYAVVLR